MQVEVETYIDRGENQDKSISELEGVTSLKNEDMMEMYATAEEKELIGNVKKEAFIASNVGLTSVSNDKADMATQLLNSVRTRVKNAIRAKAIDDMKLRAISQEDIDIWIKLFSCSPQSLFDGDKIEDRYMPLAVLEVIEYIKKTGLFGYMYLICCNRTNGGEFALFGKFSGDHTARFLLARWFEYEDKLAHPAGNLVKADKFLRPFEEIKEKMRPLPARTGELTGIKKYIPKTIFRMLGR